MSLIGERAAVIFAKAQISAATAALESMAQPEGSGYRTTRAPATVIETVNRVVRTSRQMVPEIGHEPSPEELAERLAMPLDKVHRVLAIAKRPIRLEAQIGDENSPPPE